MLMFCMYMFGLKTKSQNKKLIKLINNITIYIIIPKPYLKKKTKKQYIKTIQNYTHKIVN